MVVQSKLIDILPCCYGYVVFTAVGSTFVNMWMAMRVMRARKQYSIEYPDLYSKDNKTFNCIQRVHQNTLEGHPTFLLLLLIGGLQYPRISAGAGVIYLLGRIAYAIGYSSGDPAKRKYGGFGHIGELLLLGNTISFAAHQLGLVGGKCCH